LPLRPIVEADLQVGLQLPQRRCDWQARRLGVWYQRQHATVRVGASRSFRTAHMCRCGTDGLTDVLIWNTRQGFRRKRSSAKCIREKSLPKRAPLVGSLLQIPAHKQ
jgi:hypothetical protein